MRKKGILILVTLAGLVFLFSADVLGSVVIFPADSAAGGWLEFDFWTLEATVIREFLGEVTCSTAAGEVDTTVARRIAEACTGVGYQITYSSGDDSVVVDSLGEDVVYGIISKAGTSAGATAGMHFKANAPTSGTKAPGAPRPYAQAVVFTLKGTAAGDGHVKLGVKDRSGPEDIYTEDPAANGAADILDRAQIFFQGPPRLYRTFRFESGGKSYLYVYMKQGIEHNTRDVTDSGLSKLARGFEFGLLGEEFDIGIVQLIPTLSQWGMIALAVLIIASGVWMLWRRKRLSLERKTTG